MSHRLVVVVSDGAVATSSLASHTTSGSDEPVREDVSVILAVRVDKEEHVGESELGGDVKDTVSDDLGIDGDLVDSLAQGPDDRVSGPEDEGHKAEEPEKTPSLALPVLGGDRTASDEDIKDHEESNTADSVPTPFVPLSFVIVRSSNTSKQASDDHEDIGKDS